MVIAVPSQRHKKRIMKKLLQLLTVLAFTFFATLPSTGANDIYLHLPHTGRVPKTYKDRWMVEAEPGGYVTWSKDSVADIYAPKGLTLWNTTLLKGNITIEYEACIVGDGRVSDLNCFWMATDPEADDVFVNAEKRGGAFLNTYTMRLYYMGYGGNHNSTTRFRRYDGDKRGVKDARFRPAILREYTDSARLLRGDHWYKIKIEARDGRTKYSIDGECLVDYVDPLPLTEGYFGFRTTLSHARMRNWRVTHHDNSAGMTSSGIRLHAVTNREAVPAAFGIPFAQGEVEKDAILALTSNGETMEADQWTLASWPDGSVKWKAFTTVVAPLQDKTTKGRQKRNTPKPLIATSTDGALFDSVCINGQIVLGKGWVTCNGRKLPVSSMRRERQGSVSDCWRADGENFTLRLYTYSGSNEIKIVHTAFIDSTTNADGLQSLSMRFEIPMKGPAHERKILFLMDSTKVQTMDVKPLIARRPIRLNGDNTPADSLSNEMIRQIAAWDGFRLSQLSPNGFSVRKRATEASPWIGTIEGHRAPGIVAVGDRSHGAAFHITDFWQSYPSTLQVDKARGDKAIVSLYLWSPEAETMRFTHYDTIPHGLNAAYEDVQPGMSTACGIARTSTVYITLSTQDIDSMTATLPALARHPQYLPSPQYLHSKRAFGIWSLDKGTPLDTLLYNIKDFYAKEQERHSWYGFFNYGDVMHSYDTSRDEWRYDVGGYAWDNTELGTPAMLWYEFLRTGDVRTFDMAIAMSRHNAEVDCYHNGPHAGLGTRHNVLHWGCGAKEARISQAFWNRFMYYLTTDERMGDVMREVVDADQLLYTLDPMRLAQPRSDKHPCTAPARLRVGPDWMAYAGNWFTEWERTGNTLYRDKILAGMRSIAALPHGLFSGPKALGYDPATGIVSWEGDSSVQNTNHLMTIMGGFEMMNEMMLSITTPEWSKVWLRHAAEYKSKALTISNNHFRIPRLQAYAYWKTGKEKYFNNAIKDLRISSPILFTNDAATFTLDAIFMQEVGPSNH